MKKKLILIAIFLLGAIGCFAAFCIDFTEFDMSGLITSAGVSLASLPLIWVKDDGSFKELSKAEIDSLPDDQKDEYHEALIEHRFKKDKEIAEKIKSLEEIAEKTEEQLKEIQKLKTQLGGLKLDQIEAMIKSIKLQGEEIKRLRENGNISRSEAKNHIKEHFDNLFANIEGSKEKYNDSKQHPVYKAFAKGKQFIMQINKATQSYGDITPAEDLAQMRQGISDIPVRKPVFRSLFRTTPLSTEFYKYMRQNTVVRDAQNVAVCSPVVSNTKETVVIENIGVKKVKDIIDFCLDFISDYPFMQSRIRRLIDQSLMLRIDQQILLGTGLGNECNSINSYSSEFSAANPACVVTASIANANFVDLLKAMETQIIELGKQNSFSPNIAIVNKCDWFLLVDSDKDANNNYLNNKNVTIRNGVPYIGEMMVVWSPIVAQNTCYVIDSTMAEIIDRQVLEIEIATESGTDWEQEQAKIKAFERLNLFLDPNWLNAFMKCSDVATAIAAIDKP